ncbi:hypothetical protein SOVF_117320 [Spinacia oleracea]|uniref:Uncharacterized protein n=1 Tax=Spinacia oleracea TaxID=3562 RepID=A0A9R0IL75_SPIOL|nr:uncharacterized protein LOC110790847 [Spinacia oleracea]KNA13412.1 hypothetical protein SOVF_117320 [Spinacia oleracea]
MAFYAEEDEVWKCSLHPSKRRRTGVCSSCLKERLAALCPDCANVRPCSCYATTSSSSSASSSFSLHFSDVGRISKLIDGEPAFRRSRSSAFPFFRSARYSTADDKPAPEKLTGKESSSFWSMIWWQKKPRKEKMEAEMRRSRSVAVAGNDVRGSKGKGWYFPSPMKVFRQTYSKTPKVVHERSPLHRG